MLIKFAPIGAQLPGLPAMQLVKMSSRGLRGYDLNEFIKSAGHHFIDALRKMDHKPGEEILHLNALGATEVWGPNRNGDGFKIATCIKYHPTFVEHARWYRDHLNKDPQRSYGIVKLSHFHPTMHRIELLVGLNATKEAADRNKGLIADDEIDCLSKGLDLPVSMSTKVPYDVCSGCGHKSATREEYCDENNCKYGGLRDNLGKIASDGHLLHADNPVVCWSDISNVRKSRPADRTAYVYGQLKAS
jgi:hypothetical protein